MSLLELKMWKADTWKTIPVDIIVYIFEERALEDTDGYHLYNKDK